ncbi:hypothetical protein VP236O401_P0026 [Vibrio phage 236O40-1]|nr:hypothetical protein VP236O401_P0026 [Vibrio phage 236O40-1]
MSSSVSSSLKVLFLKILPPRYSREIKIFTLMS